MSRRSARLNSRTARNSTQTSAQPSTGSGSAMTNGNGSPQPTYQFASSSAAVPKTAAPHKRGGFASRHHRRSHSEDTDQTDGAGSLTYSATSSVQSGGSAAGESTDSSFADIMRVLDLQDSDQLRELIRKEGVTSVDELQRKRGMVYPGGSVASSLQYSAASLQYSIDDGESHLEGTRLLQTITGQPSDSYAFDGGGVGDENLDLLFAPAAPAVVKKTKGNKVVLGKERSNSGMAANGGGSSGGGSNANSSNANNNANAANTTPKSSRHGRTFQRDDAEQRQAPASSPSPTKSTPTRSPPHPPISSGDPGTPPLKPRRRFAFQDEEEDVWYKEWWMSCFPDAFKNIMPRR